MKKPLPHKLLYALFGALVSLGAPIGAILWRVVWPARGTLELRLLGEWHRAGYLYAYMTVGVIFAFAMFGWILGKHSDALSNQSEAVKDSFATLNLLAITDGLTGLYNHRYLQERIALEMESADRYGMPVTCIMLDIDDFKRVNDTYGHPFGDLVLMMIARIIRENVRRVDMVARYGGEEFFVLMPHTASDAALPIAERIRAGVENYNFSTQGREIKITLSIGMAAYPSPGIATGNKQSLLGAADAALYQAKHQGKNKTVVWRLPQAAPSASSVI